MADIWVVDDQNDILESLGKVLRHDSHNPTLINSGVIALKKLEEHIPDLLILDIGLNEELDGIQICRILRRDARFITLPILFLTARGGTDDVVTGLDAGADDYVAKPFELAELRARISAMLRRANHERNTSTVIELNGLRLDSDTYQIMVSDKSVQLTSTEHRLLRYLMEHPNQALSPSHLLQAVWEYPPNTGDPDLVRAHVRNLRAKIEKNATRRYIRTIHGVGYMISS